LLVGGLGMYRVGTRRYFAYRQSHLHGRRVYDDKADTAALLRSALVQATSEHKHVLVVMGGNWCQWCLSLDELMSSDAEIHEYVGAHFILLKLDNVAAEAQDLAWGEPSKNGVPVMVFLDPDGKVLHVQETVSLEAFGGRLLTHDRGRILALLRQWS
jgi:hypothetical protein